MSGERNFSLVFLSLDGLAFGGWRWGENEEGWVLEMFYVRNIFVSDKLSSEHATEMEDIKSLVHRLFVALHLEDHQIRKEKELLQKLDHLKEELLPLEQVRKWGYFFFKLKSISFHQE